MTIHISLLSAEATFNFTGNKPAISGFKSAEVIEGDDGGDERSRDRSTAATNNTLVGEYSDCAPLHTINWLAGVGDVCSGISRRGEEERGNEDQKAGISRTIPPAYQIPLQPRHRDKKQSLNHGHGEKGGSNTRRSALRRHCDFWDQDQDGVIYPWDIFIGFRRLGFNIALCLWAAVTMAFCSSYSTQSSYLPHPFFAIYLNNVNRNRHGSTTGAYDLDAELDTRRFDMIFEKYAGGRDYLTWRTMYDVWAGQCCANDWFGWFAGGLECKHGGLSVVLVMRLANF